MTLSEEAIERYSRQILLPSVGGRGQERLLASTVALRGGGRAMEIAAAYLCGAGVGRLALEDGARSPFPIRGRNPDSILLDHMPRAPEAAVEIGSPPERFPWPASTIVLWGAASGHRVVRVAFPAGEKACGECLRDLPIGHEDPAGAAGLFLGTLVATDALRMLLGVGPAPGSTVFWADLDEMTFSSASFPGSTGAEACRHRDD